MTTYNEADFTYNESGYNYNGQGPASIGTDRRKTRIGQLWWCIHFVLFRSL